MIDEKRLDEIRNHAELPTRDMISFSHREALELARLARLGLWVEMHGRFGLVMIGLECVKNLNPDRAKILALCENALAKLSDGTE